MRDICGSLVFSTFQGRALLSSEFPSYDPVSEMASLIAWSQIFPQLRGPQGHPFTYSPLIRSHRSDPLFWGAAIKAD